MLAVNRAARCGDVMSLTRLLDHGTSQELYEYVSWHRKAQDAYFSTQKQRAINVSQEFVLRETQCQTG